MVKRKRETKVEEFGIKVIDEISHLDGKRFYKSFEINGNLYSINSFILTKSSENSKPDVRMITNMHPWLLASAGIWYASSDRLDTFPVNGKAVSFQTLYGMHPAELLYQEKEDPILPEMIIKACAVDTLADYNDKQKRILNAAFPKRKKPTAVTNIDHFFVERSYSDRSRSNKPIKFNWGEFLIKRAEIQIVEKKPIAKTRRKVVNTMDTEITENSNDENDLSSSLKTSMIKKKLVRSNSVDANKPSPASSNSKSKKRSSPSKPHSRGQKSMSFAKSVQDFKSDTIFDFDEDQPDKLRQKDKNETAKADKTSRRSSRRRSNAKAVVIEESGDSASEDGDFSNKLDNEISDSEESEDTGDLSEDSEPPKTIFITSRKTKTIGRKLVAKKNIPNFKISERREDRKVGGNVFEQAAELLHVSAVPTSLPCREEEFLELYGHLSTAIDDASGTYISGVPGTGKTATVKSVLRTLEKDVEEDNLGAFDFVEINGMRLSEPQQAYTALWQGLTGNTVSPSHAEELLSNRFSSPSKSSRPVVVLMDELDVLVTKKQSVVYNFFNWPNFEYSKLIVVAIANTMDLPERMLSTKVSSRLGLTRITFPSYSFRQLTEIVKSRLEGLDCMEPDAIEFCARNVASVVGDARRCLDICRYGISLFSRALELFLLKGGSKTSADMSHIHMAIKEMTTSSSVKAIQFSSLHQQLFLLASIKQMRASGLVELQYGQVLEELFLLCRHNRISIPPASLLHSICSYLGQYQLLIVEGSKAGNPSQKIKLAVDQQDVLVAVTQAGHSALESKIIAAKQKLAKFQKKKLKSAAANQIKAETASSSVDQDSAILPMQNASDFDHQPSDSQQHQQYTEAEQYYYDMYNQIAAQLQQSEEDHLQTKNELISLKQNFEEYIASAAPKINSGDNHDSVQVQFEAHKISLQEKEDWCRQEASRLSDLEKQISMKIDHHKSKEIECSKRMEELFFKEEECKILHQQNIDMQLKLEQGKDWVKLQEDQLKLREEKLLKDISEFSKHPRAEREEEILDYKSKIDELLEENAYLQSQLNTFLNSQANPGAHDSEIYQRLENQESTSVQIMDRLADLQESNKQILSFMQSTSLNSATEFCKAVTELSRTNNHLLQYVPLSASKDFYRNPRYVDATGTESIRELVRARIQGRSSPS